MRISIIVAISKNNVIGVDNQLPWHLPADLQDFKKRTTHHTIIMGRKTFDSIGKALPNRTNIVITRDTKFNHADIIAKHNIEDALTHCTEMNFDEIFIIGGETIYKQTIAFADKLYLTKVDVTIENGTAFFPEINTDEWDLIDRDAHKKDEKNQYDFAFEVYEKKNQV